MSQEVFELGQDAQLPGGAGLVKKNLALKLQGEGQGQVSREPFGEFKD